MSTAASPDPSPPRPCARRAGTAILAGLSLLVGARDSSARGVAPAAPAVAIQAMSDTALVVDGNASRGPHGAYLSYRITNVSGAPLPDLAATLAGLGPVAALGGGQTATQYVGTLAPGASRTLFWFVTYPATVGLRATPTVAVTDAGGASTSGAAPLRTVAASRANQGGVIAGATISGGSVVGQQLTMDVHYDFTTWKAGDQLAVQPAGNTDFAAGCFQLVSTLVLSAAPSLDAVLVPGRADELSFLAPQKSAGGGGAKRATVRYTFRVLCAATSTTPLPYSTLRGGNNARYSNNYGTGGAVPGSLPAAPSPAATYAVAKGAATPQLGGGGSETFTVTVTNRSGYAVTIDSLRDVLPAGVVFSATSATGDVNATSSSAMPASGATGAVAWRATPLGQYAIAPGGTLRLVYTAAVTAAPGEYFNAVTAFVGPTALGTASAAVTVGRADLAVIKTGPASAAMQDTITYAVMLRNAGPATAYRTARVDTLPAGVTYVRSTGGGVLANGVLTWPTLASLAAGASRTDSIVVIAPATPTTLLNRAAAWSASADPDPTNNDGSAPASQVSTLLTSGVNVTPDGPLTPQRRLPGPRYSQHFTIENQSGSAASYGLRARIAGTPAMLAIDSLTGPALTTRPRADSAVAGLSARAVADVTVWYTVPPGDTATGIQTLTVRHLARAATVDSGWVALRRVFPALTIVRSVSPGGTVSPGAALTFAMAVTNVGEADASGVRVSDDIPPSVDFQVGSPSAALPSGVTATVEYSNDAGATWTYAPVSGACAAPAGYDGCVTQVRWTLAAPLPPSGTPSTVQYVGRVR